MPDKETPPRPWILRALLATLVAVVLLVAKDWAYVPTFRLYLDHRAASGQSAAAQQFAIEGDRVVPLIVTRGADRVAVATEVGQRRDHPRRSPRGRAARRYAIEWRSGPARRVLAEGTVDGSASIACAYPTGTGVLDLVSDGAITWVDPRVVRSLPVWPYVWIAGLLILCRAGVDPPRPGAATAVVLRRQPIDLAQDRGRHGRASSWRSSFPR